MHSCRRTTVRQLTPSDAAATVADEPQMLLPQTRTQTLNPILTLTLTLTATLILTPNPNSNLDLWLHTAMWCIGRPSPRPIIPPTETFLRPPTSTVPPAPWWRASITWAVSHICTRRRQSFSWTTPYTSCSVTPPCPPWAGGSGSGPSWHCGAWLGRARVRVRVGARVTVRLRVRVRLGVRVPAIRVRAGAGRIKAAPTSRWYR